MFVSTEPIRITNEDCEQLSDTDTDAIYIKPKMDFGTKQRVMSAAIQLSEESGVQVGKGVRVDVQFGAIQTALLVHNIVRWSGPSFAEVPCTPDNIVRLDPDEPLVQKVLRELDTRNPGKKQSPDPKSLTMPSGSKSAGD
jgi:hypothetical protein